jgi:hypothetical protein
MQNLVRKDTKPLQESLKKFDASRGFLGVGRAVAKPAVTKMLVLDERCTNQKLLDVKQPRTKSVNVGLKSLPDQLPLSLMANKLVTKYVWKAKKEPPANRETSVTVPVASNRDAPRTVQPSIVQPSVDGDEKAEAGIVG